MFVIILVHLVVLAVYLVHLVVYLGVRNGPDGERGGREHDSQKSK